MNILDKNFKYTHSSRTDVSKTFARIRREMAEQAKVDLVNVTPIKKKVAK